eukprot:scaffold2.g7286.t1
MVDGSSRLAGRLAISWTSHLGASCAPLYPTLDAFLQAVARVAAARAPLLGHLRLDMESYGLGLASRLLGLPLPRLRSLALQNCEPQHLMALARLPALRHLSMSRHISGMVSPGPTAEGLLAQLSAAGQQLTSLELKDYRMLAGVVGSVADAAPHLRRLALAADRVDRGSCLDLAPLSRLLSLQQLELCLLGSRHSDEVGLGPLAPGVSALHALTALYLAHVRAAEAPAPAPAPAVAAPPPQLAGGGGVAQAAAAAAAARDFWGSLALLPALRLVQWEEAQQCAREPPEALLRLPHLRTLILEGFIHQDDPPFSTWTALPPLPPGALPSLEALVLDCVGLQALPPSWCARALTRLHISAGVRHRVPDHVDLPTELEQLAPSLRTLELPACGLRALPPRLAALTGLTRLDLSRNWFSGVRDDALSTLGTLRELVLLETPVSPAALSAALRPCTALRRLVVGARRGCGGGGAASPLRWAPLIGRPPGGRLSGAAASSSGSGSGGSGESGTSASSCGGVSGSFGGSLAQTLEEELSLQLPWVRQLEVGSL